MSEKISPLLTVLFSITLAFAPAQAQDVVKVGVQQDVPYGAPNGPALLLDIYSPTDSTAIHPAVVLIHGGSWSSLDKSTMSGMGKFLARSGFVAFSVDYRLLQGTQNRWPAQLDDVQRAVRWVRANAAKYNVSPDRVGAFGHSAGAQLASLLGMEDTRDNSDPALAQYSSRVQAVVDVSGPTDFTNIGNGPDGLAFFANLFGTALAKHPDVWREASPVFHISKHSADGLAAFLIFHGTKDEDVPMSQAEEFYKKLKSAGASVSFVKVDDAHTFQKPEARRQLATASVAFFNQCLSVARVSPPPI